MIPPFNSDRHAIRWLKDHLPSVREMQDYTPDGKPDNSLYIQFGSIGLPEDVAKLTDAAITMLKKRGWLVDCQYGAAPKNRRVKLVRNDMSSWEEPVKVNPVAYSGTEFITGGGGGSGGIIGGRIVFKTDSRIYNYAATDGVAYNRDKITDYATVPIKSNPNFDRHVAEALRDAGNSIYRNYDSPESS